jgi:hypothetical protein
MVTSRCRVVCVALAHTLAHGIPHDECPILPVGAALHRPVGRVPAGSGHRYTLHMQGHYFIDDLSGCQAPRSYLLDEHVLMGACLQAIQVSGLRAVGHLAGRFPSSASLDESPHTRDDNPADRMTDQPLAGIVCTEVGAKTTLPRGRAGLKPISSSYRT